MPSYKDSILLPHHNSRLAGPIHHLEEDDPVIAGRFSPGGTCRRNLNLLSEPFTCDEFRMYDYKVRRCMRGRSHDWTDCPFAHPGEKARRRDPRKIHYSGELCPDFRRGSCQRGDACKYAHGVFECWLHPARYRTQPCKDGKDCTRKVCFFAHSMQQLRHVGAPVEESLAEGAPIDSHELYPHIHEFGSTVGMGLLEDSFRERVSMVDSYEHEVELALRTNSSALSSHDVYANVGPISQALSSQNSSSSPFEAILTMGFSSNNAMGVSLEVHPPSPNFSSVAPAGVPSNGIGIGEISENDPSMFEQSTAPANFSTASCSQQPYSMPAVKGLFCSNGQIASQHSSDIQWYRSQQAAARQNFPIRERHCGQGGEAILNASADGVSETVHFRRYGDKAMVEGFMNASDADEVSNELNGASKLMGVTDQLAMLRTEMYEFSSHCNACGSYGLSSPTSTLAGALYLSPFASPPLSPLSTLSSESSNIFSSRGHGNVQVGSRIPKADAHIQNRQCVKQLELNHIFTDQQSLDSNHHSHPVRYGAIHRCHELPSFSLRTSRQNKWIRLCNNWNAEGTYRNDMWHEICDGFGEEGRAENTMPDLGWVHELVT